MTRPRVGIDSYCLNPLQPDPFALLEWGGGQHVPFDTATWEPKDLLPGNRKAAEEAVRLDTKVIRSCSGGFFRWHEESPETEDLLRAMAVALRPQRPLFEDLGTILAIELHF